MLLTYVSSVMPGHRLHSVPGDGLCILHSFIRSFEAVNKIKTVDELKKALVEEVMNNHSYESIVSGAKELVKNFVLDPLAFYNDQAGDVIIPALSNFFNVNVVVLQSTDTRCWTDHTAYRSNRLDTLYFGKSLSAHFDPILPFIKTEASISIIEIPDSSSSDEGEHIAFSNAPLHNGDINLPIYNEGQREPANTDDIVRALLNDDSVRGFICATNPRDVRENKEFVVSRNCCPNERDVFSDGSGHWEKTQTRTILYGRQNKKIVKISESEKELFSEVITVTRMTHYYRTCKNFHRVAIFIKDCHHLYLQYYFDRKWNGLFEEDTSPHGNRKVNKQPYIRTKASVKEKLKSNSNVLGMKPRDAVTSAIEEVGGMYRVNGPEDIPRNRQQVYNLNRTVAAATTVANTARSNDFTILNEMSFETDPEEAIVRNVSSSPEFYAFLATDRQLNDVERFCTRSDRFSILGIDPTYNIGPCYVTLTTYRHLHFRTVANEHPVMIGPILLHQRKEYDSYFPLASHMVQKRKGLKNILVIGSDSEKNVYQPFMDILSNPLHQYCNIHIFQNVKEKLKGHTLLEQKEILRDIFGENRGVTLVKGVVDAESSLEFEELFVVFCTKWAKYPTLIDYMKKEKEAIMSTCMRADVRAICGLGYPPKPYTQNPNECINRWLKDTLKNNQCKNLVEVVELLKWKVKQQTIEIIKALSGEGNSGWVLDETLKGSKFDIGARYYQKKQGQRKKICSSVQRVCR